MAQGIKWEDDEFIVALNSYYLIYIAKTSKKNAELDELEKLSKRTRASWDMRLYHYRFIHTSHGLPAGARLCQPFWDKYQSNWALLVSDAIDAKARLAAIMAASSKHTHVPVSMTSATGLSSSSGVSYYWINCKPSIWKTDEWPIGDTQEYTLLSEKGNPRKVPYCFNTIKAGDYIIGYETNPGKRLKCLFEVTQGKHCSPTTGKEVIEFKKIENFTTQPTYAELSANPILAAGILGSRRQGSLFSISEEEFNCLVSWGRGGTSVVVPPSYTPYSFDSDLDKPFIDKTQFEHIAALLSRKKNIIIQGAPGVGKTFISKKIAYQIMGHIDDSKIEMVQFHQSYGYEDFIQGYRPQEDGTFKLLPGVFYSFCENAAKPENKDEKFFFIIDEINRGNISKIFGEMMLLLEADKRGEQHSIHLTYQKEGERFSIPENVYLIGCMNTSDRSIAILDYALRRRFSIIPLRPCFNDTFKDFLKSKLDASFVDDIVERLNGVNESISSREMLRGMEIGHSYFCNISDAVAGKESDWWKDICDYELFPYIEDICFDDESLKDELKNRLTL